MGMSGHASGDAVFGVTIGMTCLAGIVVLTRLFTRVRIVRDPGLDDAFIVAAILFSIATTVTMCLQGKRNHHLFYDSESSSVCSQVRHGTPYGDFNTLRGHAISEAILRINLGLQPFHVMHEVLDSAPVPQNLPSDQLQTILLWTYGYRGYIHVLDILQCCVCLLADTVFLESAGSSQWALFASISCLVGLLQCLKKYL